jgi:hypothetical protein
LIRIVETAILDPDFFDDLPCDYKNGTNFIIHKTKQGEYASYTSSAFQRKSTALSPEEVKNVKKHLVDLSTVLPEKPKHDDVQKLLHEALGWGSSDE